MKPKKTAAQLKKELAELRLQLDEANALIKAIQTEKTEASVAKGNTNGQPYPLKSANHNYGLFIEKMMDGAVTLNRTGLILYSNSKFAKMVSTPLQNVVGQAFLKFVNPHEQEKFSALLKQGWSQESKGEISLKNEEKNEPVPVLISLTKLKLKDGMALSIIITDLSLQKENEKQLTLKNTELSIAHYSLAALNNKLEVRVDERTRELMESREYFKFLADNIPVIVWTAGTSGEVNYFNKRWYKYAGKNAGSAIDWKWQLLIHPGDRTTHIDAWKHSLKTGDDYQAEYRLLRASDGLYRYHSAIGFAFKNEEGEIIEWFGILTDIEDQKLALTKKDEFISMASHELKTPITVLKAFNQVLLASLPQDDSFKNMDIVLSMEKQINKLIALISDLLDATKVNAGVLIFEETFFNFNALVIEVVEQIQISSKTHLIKLKLGNTLNIFADRNRISQVINNLITNAIKYSPSANKIIISTKINKENLQFYVEDFGIGIPVEQQPKLFNRFFRASEVKTNSFPGLGLGLYISNEIMKRHSGTLTFKSREGKGSIFCIELPL